MTDRFVCIHGHFYQPPRENPWLEAIERQDSAHPYHDWNERIDAECYAPNAASRILDPDGRVERIVNNYGRISFNVGPTLLSWMEAHAPETYGALLRADRVSAERFGGHGSAIAQVYGHQILPLSNGRDKRTMVLWGKADFEKRFGREPEGMWLAETAADVETLEALAEAGIAYTILAPHQAARWRPAGEEEWTEVENGGIDVGRPYVQRLPSGRSIALFFYDGPTSRAVAFEQLLESGERFAARLLAPFQGAPPGPRLQHIATDGETYGHHHRHGEMALSYALHVIEEDEGVRLTNYGEFLELHPPAHEVEIVEDTSWSCVHGVERWRANCGCHSGGRPEWSQAWREPLRQALDWLRDELAPRWEAAAAELLADPWAARDGYVDVVLDRSPDSLERFFEAHAARDLSPEERVRARQLLELQRHAMLMTTSCGWFFDELSGIETVQVIQYAGRVVQLARDLFEDDRIEQAFLERLEKAESNIPEWKNGRTVYDRAVRPAIVTLQKVAAHYAVSSLFEEYGERTRVYCYEIERLQEKRLETGRARLATGRAHVVSTITGRSREVSWAVLHTGDHNLIGGVRDYRGGESYDELVEELERDFERADYPAVIRILDDGFAADTYSLRSLFKDEQRRILKRVLEGPIARAAAQYAQIYENRAPLMRFMADLGLPPPRPFRMAAEFVLDTRLRRAMEAEPPELDAAERMVRSAQREGIELETQELAYAARRMVERAAARFEAAPDREVCLADLERRVEFAKSLPFEVVLWGVQNTFWRVLREAGPPLSQAAAGGDAAAREWLDRLARLGETLSVAMPPAD